MSFDKNMKVLVIDDMAVMRKMITKILAKEGINNFDSACHGKEALVKIKEAQAAGTPFGLIISDWNMPEMSGLELLKELRASVEFKLVPFLMVTAEGEKDNVIKAIQAGVSNLVVKPFTPVSLMEKITLVFAKIAATNKVVPPKAA